MHSYGWAYWLVLLVVLLVLREFVCWYWKLNDIVKLFREQNALLARQNSLLERLTGPEPHPAFDDDDEPDILRERA